MRKTLPQASLPTFMPSAMETPDLTNLTSPLHIHLIGVAGSGMSGLALLLLGMGHKVSGCDRVTSAETIRMQSLGLTFFCPQTGESVQGADLVVYSSAITSENPAFSSAAKAGIPIIKRAECLARILHTRKSVIVAGTHGKTTTSAMTAHILREADLNPSYYVGAEIPILGANAKWSKESDYMVAEGDESDGTLSLYKPHHSIILNIEAEHLDFYRGIDQIKEVFTKLCQQTQGEILYCAESEIACEVCAPFSNSISYGWEDASRPMDYTASQVRDLRGSSGFLVKRRGEVLGDIELAIPGKHNILNALAAIAMSDLCGADFAKTARALSTFAGAKRRFETTFLSRNYRVVDDYGHHPTEIEATIQTARSLAPKRLVVLFQPHRYSRTKALANEFGEVLQKADKVYVTDVYPASEVPIEGINGQTIVDALHVYCPTNGIYIPELRTAHFEVGNALQEGDLLLTLGAGNVHEVGKRIATDLKQLEDLSYNIPKGDTVAKLYEPMRKHSTILIGGPAQYWFEPQTFSAFASLVESCRARGIPIRVVGRGSNLLVRDGGIRGAVIQPKGGAFAELRISAEGHIVAGAGVRLKKLASFAASHNIGGFEWMEGIPGNVGGSLRMNAGAMGIETFDQVVRMTSLDEDGEIRCRDRAEIVSTYRNTPELRRNFALEAEFAGVPDATESIQKRWQESRDKRKVSQPVAASAGCTFKNPGSVPAGMLIEELGLKGATQGNATVSSIHANFLTNSGKASARDVITLIESIQKEAKEKRGIALETELKIIGDDEPQF